MECETNSCQQYCGFYFTGPQNYTDVIEAFMTLLSQVKQVTDTEYYILNSKLKTKHVLFQGKMKLCTYIFVLCQSTKEKRELHNVILILSGDKSNLNYMY
jgi:hypothetical protein